jgi:hypothetical protein
MLGFEYVRAADVGGTVATVSADPADFRKVRMAVVCASADPSASASLHCCSVSDAVCGRAGIAVAPASSAWNRSSSASSCESGIPWVSQA